MLKIVYIVMATLSIVVAAPQGNNDVKVMRYENERDPDGGYRFVYELSDGQIRSEAGVLKETINKLGKIIKSIVVTGAYRFFDPKGVLHWVNYKADETGVHTRFGEDEDDENAVKPGQPAGIDPNLLKTLAGK